MSSDYTVRLATSDDAAILSAIATRTFRHMTLTRLNGRISTEDLALHLASTYPVEKMRAEIEDPTRVTIFVFPKEDPERPCGYAMLWDGSIRPGDEDTGKAEEHLEVKRVYVDAAFQGKGAAHVLMGQAMDIIKEKRRKVVWLGMGPGNVQAEKFYRKHGFEISGSKQFQLGEKLHVNTVLTLQLPNDDSADRC